jgi:MFS family permease
VDDKSHQTTYLEQSRVLQTVRPWDLYAGRTRTTFLLVLFLVGTSNFVDKNIIGVVLEEIKTEFQVSDTRLGLLSGISFALLYATLGIPVARWADRHNRKLVITLSLCVWSLTTILCGLANTFWQLAASRFGVGAGEAGAIPPAQSLLADYYPPAERARAIGIFMLSGAAGYALGLVLGGFIAQNFGWRATFIMFGLAGLTLAPLSHFILKEPRSTAEIAVRSESDESIMDSIRVLLAKPAYRYVLAAMVVYWLIAYGAVVFIVSLMIRVHGVNVAQAGALFGAVSAVGSVIGSLGGGALADRLAARDMAWLSRVAGWGLIAAIPFWELALWSTSIITMVPFLFLAMVLICASSPCGFAAIHVVCGSKRRALSVALALFFANLIGLGLGPIITGGLSDMLGSAYGSGNGLRYALMIVMSLLLPAGWLYLRSAKHLRADTEE